MLGALLRYAGPITFDSKASVRGPCIVCGSCVSHRKLVVIGKYTDECGGGKVAGTPIRRPICVETCIASEYLGDGTAEEDDLSLSIFMAGLAAIEDAEARRKFVEAKLLREEEERKQREAELQTRLIDDTWLAIQDRADKARKSGQSTVDVGAIEWSIVAPRYMRHALSLNTRPSWSSIVMIQTCHGPIEVRIVADPSGDQLVERP